MPTKKLMYRRRFLNRPKHHTGAHVIARVEVENTRSGKPFVDASLRLADCNRVVELDFNVYDRADAKNALHKAKLLRDLIDEFAESLEEAIEHWEDLR